MNVALVAGGTGGHLFPAEALAHALGEGVAITLITDARAKPFLKSFPAAAVRFVTTTTLTRKTPLAAARMVATNAVAMARAMLILRRAKADIVVGFGGYPTVAPLMAAKVLRCPVVIHEANAVMGRANRFLAKGAHVATSFPDVKGLPAGTRSVSQTGMPVRPAVRQAAKPFVPPGERLNLLVFGGSQGARVFADLVPPAFEALPANVRARIDLTQQVREEDVSRVRAAYDALGVSAGLAPFFKDLPERMAAAHLVIGRSGASTVAELAVIGRPSLLVPLPGALDQDQAHNAAALEALGGARRLDQAALDGPALAAEIAALFRAPEKLAAMAEAARGLSRKNAAADLAHLVKVRGGAIGWSEDVDGVHG
ncbi:MAG: UDP-N-acetylglucosamine--N-acetylmuramyl-(pentapeptide) pyrophosphoryl-undecaprenol N-acetylglucosamine transferase [Pseudomonadota bacterium]